MNDYSIKKLEDYIENNTYDKYELLNLLSEIKDDIKSYISEKDDEIYCLNDEKEELETAKNDLEYENDLFKEIVPIEPYKVSLDVLSLYEILQEKLLKHSPNKIEELLNNL
jgi:hypothetical protein